MKKKLIILSETTGIEVMSKLAKNKIELKYCPAYIIESIDIRLKPSNNDVIIIFQSKNSVKHSKQIVEPLIERGGITMYAVGKYSADEAEATYNNECIYPKSNYSSESVIELLKDIKESHNKFIIIKGEGGRNTIEEFLSTRRADVTSLDVYRRIIKKDFFKVTDLNMNSENWLLISSKELLKKVNIIIKGFDQKFKICLIVPSKRLIEDKEKSLYKFIEVLPNSIASPDMILSIVNKDIVNE